MMIMRGSIGLVFTIKGGDGKQKLRNGVDVMVLMLMGLSIRLVRMRRIPPGPQITNIRHNPIC